MPRPDVLRARVLGLHPDQLVCDDVHASAHNSAARLLPPHVPVCSLRVLTSDVERSDDAVDAMGCLCRPTPTIRCSCEPVICDDACVQAAVYRLMARIANAHNKHVCYRIVGKERRKRGAAAKEYVQERAIQAMDARVGKARTVVGQSYSHTQELRQRLRPDGSDKVQAQSPEELAGLDSFVTQLEAELAQAQAVLGVDWEPDVLESLIDTDSAGGSPSRDFTD